MLRERQRLLVFRPEAPGPKSEPELTLMHELELTRKPEVTTPGLGARTTFVLQNLRNFEAISLRLEP